MRMLITSLGLAGFLALTARGAEPSGTTPLASFIKTWDELPVQVTPVGQRRDVVDLPTATLHRLECHVSTLRAGLTSHPPHQHDQEEFIILSRGALEVGINGKAERVEAGTLFFFAANDWHNVHTVGDEAATYFVFNVATAATPGASKDGAARTAAPGVLGSGIHHWGKLEAQRTQTGLRRVLFDSPTTTCANLQCEVITLDPGAAAEEPARHAEEELVWVKSGELDVTLNGVSRTVGPGTICFFATHDEHRLRNTGQVPAEYYVVRIRTEATPPTS